MRFILNQLISHILLERCVKIMNDRYANYSNELSKDEIQILILELINEYFDGKIKDDDFLSNTCFLVNRNVLSYKLLDNNVRNMLSCVLFDIWDLNEIQIDNNIDEIDAIFHIIINLGLQKCYDKIKNNINNVKEINSDIFWYINTIYKQNGDNISNPYANIMRFK